MRARTVMRLLLIMLAGTLALPLVASFVTLRSLTSVSRAAADGPAVVATIALRTNNPYALAVNPTTNLIYVANTGSGNVSVIDGVSNMVLTTVAVGPAPQGVAVNPTTNLIYVANMADSTVSVIDDTPPNPVGGVAEPPDLASTGSSGLGGGAFAVLGAVGGVLAITVAGTVVAKRRGGQQ